MATNTLTPDPETMDMNELRKLAEVEAAKSSTQPEPKKEPEVKKEDEPTADKPEAKKVFYAQKSFDLGDGAGSQVFKGQGGTREEALEDLSDKLLDAQRSATRRIKELKTVKPEEKKEEESLRAAKIVTNPSEVVKEILGVDTDELKDVVQEVKQNRENKRRKSVADDFVSKHPEFVDNERNGQRLAKAVKLIGDFSLDNLEKAYQDLSESGLLEVKGEEAGDGQGKGKKEEPRIEEPSNDTPSQRTKRASGISTHSRSAVAVKTEPSEDDLQKMSLDDLRKLANQQLAGK